MRARSPTWFEAKECSLTTEYALFCRARAARWRAARADRSRGRSAGEISALVDRAPNTNIAWRINFVEPSSLLEIEVIDVGTTSGFCVGSIPDHVVGAPLKPDAPLLLAMVLPAIPVHVVGAPLKPGGHRAGPHPGPAIPDHVVGAPLKPSPRPETLPPVVPIPDHVVGA